MGFVDANKRKPFFLMWTTPPAARLASGTRTLGTALCREIRGRKALHRTSGISALPVSACYLCGYDQLFRRADVGQLIEKLKAEHLYENTLIVFTSDNGPTFNGGNDSPLVQQQGTFNSAYGWGKCFLHEGGIRVPAIITWPGKIKPGTQSDHICAFQDVMPTLAELAGITCPPTDGISFLPTLLGKKGNKRTHLFILGIS